MVYLGIDCGGTNLRVGIVDENGNLKSRWKVASPLNSKPQSLAEIVKELVKDEQIDAIGIGLPGLLDLRIGALVGASNVNNHAPIDISGQFDRVFNKQSFSSSKKIHLENDVSVALLGEVWKGGAVGLERAAMLTAGTGVGSAFFLNGQIYNENGQHIELGHFIIDPNSKATCGAGHHGCLEALINYSKNLDELSKWFGIGLTKMVDLFHPEKILVWGGKMAMGDFLPKAVEVMKKSGMKPAVDEVGVEYAKLGEWSGVYGAAKLAYDSNKNA